jgi:hypothetical protein
MIKLTGRAAGIGLGIAGITVANTGSGAAGRVTGMIMRSRGQRFRAGTYPGSLNKRAAIDHPHFTIVQMGNGFLVYYQSLLKFLRLHGYLHSFFIVSMNIIN